MKKLIGMLFVVAACSGIGFAQSGFAGVSFSGLYFPASSTDSSGEFLGLIGGQVGSYDLLGPVGARLTVDYSVTPFTGFLSGSADVLLSSSGETKFYGGAGFGIVSLEGSTVPFGKAFVGGDFSVSDTISLFAEAAPNYFFQTQTLIFGGRVGVKLAFGQ